MNISAVIDGMLCTATVSRFSIFLTFVSIFLHPNAPEKWRFLVAKNIKGNSEYENWNFIYLHPFEIKWEMKPFYENK